jgi:hypothetical protein
MTRAALVVLAVALLAGCGTTDKAQTEGEKAGAIAAAEAAFAKEKATGTDLDSGPCIANPLPAPADDWVVDVAHDPRTAVDDKPANQCSAFRDGKAGHFVELDPDGNLIRAE